MVEHVHGKDGVASSILAIGFMNQGYFERAIDPHQYDKGEINWEEHGRGDTPMRLFFKEILDKEIGNLKGKNVIDIGSGTGALFGFLEMRGAHVQGIEPSYNNVAISKKLFPHIKVFESSLEKAELDKTFDVALAAMVFEHLFDVEGAFKKINLLLKNGGMFYLITHNREYLVDPSYPNPIELEKVGDSETYAAKIGEGDKIFYDLLRPASAYIDAGIKSGFILIKHNPLLPSELLLTLEPKYERYKNVPIKHLFVFKKDSD